MVWALPINQSNLEKISMLTLIMTFLPAWVILQYVYRFDRFEQEPISLMFKAFAIGCLTPVATVLLLALIDFQAETPFHMALFGAALPEEAIKFAVLYLIIWKSKHFDEYFDGIVYAVCVGLGFAVLENVLYVAQGGLTVALMRAVTAVPGHASFAVFMGYFMALARFTPAARTGYLLLALLVPILMHFLYDYLAMSAASEVHDENIGLAMLLAVAFLFFVIGMYRQAHKRMCMHIEKSA